MVSCKTSLPITSHRVVDSKVMADEHHPQSFLARFSRANNIAPETTNVPEWLTQVDDGQTKERHMALLEKSLEECVGYAYQSPCSQSAASDHSASQVGYIQRVPRNDPLYTEHHSHFEPQSEGGIIFDADDTGHLETEMETRGPNEEDVSTIQPKVVHYAGSRKTIHHDGIELDFDSIEFVDDKGKEGYEGTALESASGYNSNEQAMATEYQTDNRKKKFCDVRGHLFKGGYGVYCDKCGENLDGRRKYTCVADDCATVFCPFCAK